MAADGSDSRNERQATPANQSAAAVGVPFRLV
jgi:hypothetical protein